LEQKSWENFAEFSFCVEKIEIYFYFLEKIAKISILLQNKPWLQYPITLKPLDKISKTLDKVVDIEGGVVERAQVWRLCFFFFFGWGGGRG